MTNPRKGRPTRRRNVAARAAAAAAAETRTWREQIAARLDKARVKREKKRAEEKARTTPPPRPVRWVHEHDGPTRPGRRGYQLGEATRVETSTGRRGRSIKPPILPSGNVPYRNPDRDLKKARAAGRRRVTR